MICGRLKCKQSKGLHGAQMAAGTAWNKNARTNAAFKHAIQPDGSLPAELDDVVQDKMDGKPPIQAELKHQMGTQMAWWGFSDKTNPNIENQGKHAKWHNKARGNGNLQSRLNSNIKLARKWPGGASWTRRP
jgi:hypothetical protein